MAHRQAIIGLNKAGLQKTLGIIFPVRKEVGENSLEFREHIERKLAFDLDLPPLKTLGDFRIYSAGVPDIFSSGVAVLNIAKDRKKLLWLSFSERRYDLEIKLGETRLDGDPDGEILLREDCSHVTEEMIQETLPKFLGRISHERVHQSFSEGITQKLPAICHEIRLQAFEAPIVRLQVRCGAGFRPKYFLENLVSELGTVGHSKRLHRISQGPFTYEDAIPSYAVSWENCKKAHEKYADRLRACNWETRASLSEDDLKGLLSEKRFSKMFDHKKRRRQAESADGEDIVESRENV